MLINNILSNNVHGYQSWKKFDTMSVRSRRCHTSKRYHKLQTHLTSKLRLQNLHCNPQETHVRNFRCSNRWKQISCYQKRTTLHTLSRHNWCLIYLTNNLLQFLDIFSHRVNWDFIFSALPIFGYRNKFIHKWSPI